MAVTVDAREPVPGVRIRSEPEPRGADVAVDPVADRADSRELTTLAAIVGLRDGAR
jgi:hypothetical protein